MVKKIFGLLLLLLVIGMLPMVFAEDEIVDANTAEEIKAFNAPYGAEVRMLQLEKSITRNVLVGAQVISVIEKNHPEEDLSVAKEKLDEMEALLETVKEYTIEEKDSNNLAVEFVAMKKQAIVITQEFKQITSEILTAEDRQEVHDLVKDLDKNELETINQAVGQAIRNHNTERMTRMFGIVGLNNPELLQRINDGNATKLEVKEMVRTAYHDLNSEERIQAWNNIKEKTTKRIVAEKSLIQKAKNLGKERFMQMDANRMQRLNEWMQNRAQNFDSNGFEGIAERIQKRAEDLNNLINNPNGKRGAMQ